MRKDFGKFNTLRLVEVKSIHSSVFQKSTKRCDISSFSCLLHVMLPRALH